MSTHQPARTATLLLIPQIVVVALLPLIVRLHRVPVPAKLFQTWLGSPMDADFFAFGKLRVLLACALFAGLLFALRIRQLRLQAVALWSLAIYAATVLIATMTTAHPGVAWIGAPGRYEGALALMAYMLLFVTAAQIDTPRSVRWIIYSLVASSLVVSTIGILQLTGAAPFRTDCIQRIILPPELFLQRQAIRTPLGDRAVAATLSNPNYLGSYIAMLLPLTLTLVLATRRKRCCLLGCIVVLTQGVTLLGSGSRGGLLAAAIAILIVLFPYRGYLRTQWKRVAGLTLLVLALAGAMDISIHGTLSSPIRTLMTDARWAGGPDDTDPVRLVAITTKDASLQFDTTFETIRIKHEQGRLHAEDHTGQTLALRTAGNTIYITTAGYTDYTLVIHPDNRLDITRTGLPVLHFAWTGSTFTWIDAPDAANEQPTVAASHYDFLGSGRIYIWRRILPLLRESLLIGNGPDTFALVFPQNDTITRLNIFGRPRVIVDKPHNLYLQTAVQTGALSLLAMLSLIGACLFFLRRAIQISPDRATLHRAIFAALCGYLIAGLFNDSMVGIAPIFWILLGLAAAQKPTHNTENTGLKQTVECCVS